MYPFFNIFGVEIPLYGACMSLAIGLAILLSCIRTKRRGNRWDEIITVAMVAIICGLLGAKLLYILVTYSPKEIVESLRSEGISFIINAGLVFYGALICGVAGAFLGARLFRVKLVRHCDAIVPTLPLAHAIGRMGCFFSGCCYGRETDSWIGMCFPHSVSGLDPAVRVIPTQLIEAGANVLVFLFLLWFTRKRRRGFTTLFVYLMIYAVERFLIEFLRGDEIRGIFGLFSTSQWISLALFALGLVGLAVTSSYYKKHPAALLAEGEGVPESAFYEAGGQGSAEEAAAGGAGADAEHGSADPKNK